VWCFVFLSVGPKHDGGLAAKPTPVIYSVDRLRADAPPPVPIAPEARSMAKKLARDISWLPGLTPSRSLLGKGASSLNWPAH